MNLITKYFNELTTKELYEILKVRAEIFILEQNINYQDMDNIDYKSLHCFIEENGKIIAYLRAFNPTKDKSIVQIGRVLTINHGKGLGRKLMEDSLVKIKEETNCKKICLDAQTYAIGFYEKFGFKVTSAEFIEDEIPHVKMEKNIK